jgi:hypothetical protein
VPEVVPVVPVVPVVVDLVVVVVEPVFVAPVSFEREQPVEAKAMVARTATAVDLSNM